LLYPVDDGELVPIEGDEEEYEDAAAFVFVLLPVLDEPGALMAVFSDGSYTRYVPPCPSPDCFPTVT
jgi:hypothetical protein